MAYEMRYQSEHDTSGAPPSLSDVMTKIEGIERQLSGLASSPVAELAGPVELLLSGLTDDMVAGLVTRFAALAEFVLDPAVLRLLERLRAPETLGALERLTDPSTLEALDGLTGLLALVHGGLTDDMVAGLASRASALAELALDPFVLDALSRAARALKAGQAEYPDVKVPPVGGAFGALRSANDEDTRRVAAFALAVMRNLGHQFA